MQVQTIIINKTTWGRVKNNLYATKSSCWTKLYRRTPSVTHKDNALNLNPDRCITIQDFLDPRSRWRDLRTKQLPETCCDTCHPSDNIRRVSSETEQPSEPKKTRLDTNNNVAELISHQQIASQIPERSVSNDQNTITVGGAVIATFPMASLSNSTGDNTGESARLH